MVSETEAFYAGILTVNGLLAAFTAYYYNRRLKLEERKVLLEEQKLELRKGNGT